MSESTERPSIEFPSGGGGGSGYPGSTFSEVRALRAFIEEALVELHSRLSRIEGDIHSLLEGPRD